MTDQEDIVLQQLNSLLPSDIPNGSAFSALFENINEYFKSKDLNEHQGLLKRMLPLIIESLPMVSDNTAREIMGFICSEYETPQTTTRYFGSALDFRLGAHRELISSIVKIKIPELSFANRQSVFEVWQRHGTRGGPANKLLNEIAKNADGIDENFIQSVLFYAKDNMHKFVETFLSAHQEMFRPTTTPILTFLLHSVYATNNLFPIEDLNNKLPTIIRHVADAMVDRIHEEQILDLGQYSGLLDDISNNFYPRLKETLDILKELDKTPFGNIYKDAVPLAFVDGRDLVRIKAVSGNSLDETVQKIFVYDGDFGYANSMAHGWRRAMTIAMNGKPLQASDIMGLYDVVGNAMGRQLISENNQGDVVDYSIDSNAMTEEGLKEINEFMSFANSLKEDDKNFYLRFRASERLFKPTIKDTSYENAKSTAFYLASTRGSLKLTERIIGRLVADFNNSLANVGTFEEAEDAAIKLSKQVEWLHAGTDANGRISAHFVRNICLIKAQLHFGLEPTVITPFDPYIFEVKSASEYRPYLRQSKSLSAGQMDYTKIPLPPVGLTASQVRDLNEKYPMKVNGLKVDLGWELKKTLPSEPCNFMYEGKSLEQERLVAVTFSLKPSEGPREIYKVKAEWLSEELKIKINAGELTYLAEIPSSQILTKLPEKNRENEDASKVDISVETPILDESGLQEKIKQQAAFNEMLLIFAENLSSIMSGAYQEQIQSVSNQLRTYQTLLNDGATSLVPLLANEKVQAQDQRLQNLERDLLRIFNDFATDLISPLNTLLSNASNTLEAQPLIEDISNLQGFVISFLKKAEETEGLNMAMPLIEMLIKEQSALQMLTAKVNGLLNAPEFSGGALIDLATHLNKIFPQQVVQHEQGIEPLDKEHRPPAKGISPALRISTSGVDILPSGAAVDHGQLTPISPATEILGSSVPINDSQPFSKKPAVEMHTPPISPSGHTFSSPTSSTENKVLGKRPFRETTDVVKEVTLDEHPNLFIPLGISASIDDFTNVESSKFIKDDLPKTTSKNTLGGFIKDRGASSSKDKPLHQLTENEYKNLKILFGDDTSIDRDLKIADPKTSISEETITYGQRAEGYLISNTGTSHRQIRAVFMSNEQAEKLMAEKHLNLEVGKKASKIKQSVEQSSDRAHKRRRI